MFKVIIDEPHDVRPCTRLLEALTRTGLLDSKITWTETANGIVLNVDLDDQAMIKFQQARFVGVRQP